MSTKARLRVSALREDMFIRLPDEIAKQLGGWKQGTDIALQVEDGALVVRRVGDNTDRVSVPRKSTERMGQAAYEEAGSPSDWYGFSDMWDAAIREWEEERNG